jgi:Beta-propeller domains of methanol dehydrogenase type
LFGAPTFPQLSGRVVDEAGLLDTHRFAVLTQMLEQHENNTTNQIVIVTLRSLQGYEIEEYGYQLGRHWGIGQKGVDNGLLFIVAPNERKVRIEVGYGLEGVMTDKTAHDIIQEVILPSFKKGDFAEGIMNGTDAILAALKGEYTPKRSEGLGDTDLGRANVLSGAFTILFFLYLFHRFFRDAKQKEFEILFKFSQFYRIWSHNVVYGAVVSFGVFCCGRNVYKILFLRQFGRHMEFFRKFGRKLWRRQFRRF